MSDKPIVRLGGMFVEREFIDKLKRELANKAMLIQTGLDDQISPCEQFTYEILKKEGWIETPVDLTQEQ